MDEDQTQNAADTGADSQINEDSWDDAASNFLADKGIEKKDDADAGKSDDTNKSDDQGADDAAANGGEADPNKKSDDSEENVDPNKDPKLEQETDEAAPYREARQVQREIEADRTQMREDIKKEMYSDWSDDITDDEGDPLRTPADVMKHINPLTKKPFTQEEATAWLFAAQKHKDQQRAEMNEKVEKIAETNIVIRDETDYIKGKYGQLLKDLPDLRKEIWADYKATLIIDKTTGLIVDAPVSLQKFFERALQPYAEYAERLQSTNTKKSDPVKDANDRKQSQQDREDLHSSGGSGVTDPEEQGWADAARNYYEGK